MAWLLGLCDALVRGTALYVALQTLVLFGTLAVLTLSLRRVSPAGVAVALLLCASPLVLIWQGIVWKDVLFADLAVAGFVALHLGLRPSRSAWPRALLIVLAFVFLGAGALARQNGIVLVVMAALALGHGLFRQERRRRRLLASAAPAAIALAATLCGMLLVQQALFRQAADPDGPKWQLNMLQAYDLVGAVAGDPALKLDQLKPPTAAMIRAAARDIYTPARNDELLNNDFEARARRADAEIRPQWRDLVLHHAGLWLNHRAQVFRWLFTTPDLEVCYADAVGVDGRPDQLAALGLKEGQSPRDIALERYAARFHASPVYSHPAYALLAVILMVLMFRSPRREDAVFGFMLAGALLFVASFAAIGVACDYRYLYASDLSTMAAAFFAALRGAGLFTTGSGSGREMPA
jgi:hypothetical protein